MSDFVNNFWSVYITGITLVGILACFVMLIITARKKVVSDSDNTTGHVWDEDLRELNNPMPRWWVWLFVITLVFGLLYLAAYPGLGAYTGKLQWNQVKAYNAEVEQAEAREAPLYARFTAMSTEEVAQDGQAMAIGERLFMNNCAQCHGSDARGSKGFPNLVDGDWLHGGAPENIKQTITEGRIGMMAPQAEVVGTPEDVRNLAHYVLSLSNSPHDPVKAGAGESKFMVCAACHGADGKGNILLGAPNLTDDVWLHGWGEQAIIDMITNGKMNEMPAQKQKLTPAQIDVLTAYVWGLSNNKSGASN
jgi:cytochrome c oxidase cbb3-type subunit III